ncbi:glycosyltransferase [Clostridium prolinivorans]|uniref:glycosyltransferase n=1 Tax=Clostridium prolinivorans TaxID=2769420 RepID=UPI000FD96651|nr:glycosyltransferase [Clostridium prolinivorans]
MKDNDIKVSVILPAYNVEPYINKCLDSLLNQSLKEIEIIVVNDGSTDNTIDVIQKYKKYFEHILIIEQKNKGLSAARNIGLKYAKGKYVFFLDSDDFIDTKMLEELYKECEINDLDIICFNGYYYNDSKDLKIIREANIDINNIYCGINFLQDLINFNAYLPMVWLNMYKKEFLLKNKLCFMEGVYHEDIEFTPRAYILAQKVKYNNKPFYYYIQRKGSITKTKSNKNYLDILKIIESLINFVDELKNKKINTLIYIIITKVLLTMYKEMNCIAKNDAYYIIDCINNNHKLKQLEKNIEKLQKKDWIRSTIIKFPKLIVKIYKIGNKNTY